MINRFDFLSDTIPPYVIGADRIAVPKILAHVLERDPDVKIVRIKGEALRDWDALHSAFARAFHFPDYYGENLDALDECLTDLQWFDFSNLILVFTEASQAFRFNWPTVELLSDILRDAGQAWSVSGSDYDGSDRPKRPFHTIFEIDKESSRGAKLTYIEI